MTDATRFQFHNPSVPKAYDEFLVPRLFEPWAKLLLDEADLRPGESVLDVATGPGTVARLAAVRVGAKGRVVATDIAQPMLDIAKAKGQPSAAAAPIDYLYSPAAPLAAATGTFDAVLCQQGLQFFPDRPSALREMRRVLRPSGRTAIAVWGELARNQIYAAFHAALQATVRSDLAELITAPFSWPSGTALKSAAEDAGFRNVRLSTRSLSMVLEGGLEQAIQSFAATPVAPGVGELPQDVQQAFFAHLRQEMTRLLRDGKVIGEMTSNMIIAHC
ncbi:MAG: methyltransferase domain-containing protein [Alphaproteobacteria bacterium]|nr:MAG: methyltransferase domain-containing protein [Alphaproteobacteria bacterium]